MKSYRTLLYVFVLVLSISFILYSANSPTIASEINDNPITAKFEYLTENRNSACYGMSAVMEMNNEDTIRGSCCGPMILHRYREQLEALKQHENIEIIPKDPYNISVDWAQEMINDFKTIQLSSEQQKIYEDAKKMSMEGGPCCCGNDEGTGCWRWNVYGELAKKLITEYNFDAEQIAHVWDISDGCGGDHHIDEVHG